MAKIVQSAYLALKSSPLERLLKKGYIPPLAPKPLPRIIWMFWAQGWEEAPEIVRLCAQSWRDKNLDWDLRLLTMQEACATIDMSDLPDTLPIQMFSDMLRLRLLAAHGGVWADATSYCALPLSHWLPPLMQAGFFAFDRPGRDRIMANWFLASAKDGTLVRQVDAHLTRYWRTHPAKPPYFIFHYLFEYMLRTDRNFRHQWDNVPKLSAQGAHLVGRKLKDGPDGLRDLAGRNLGAIPMHKLSWKADIDLSMLKSILELD